VRKAEVEVVKATASAQTKLKQTIYDNDALLDYQSQLVLPELKQEGKRVREAEAGAAKHLTRDESNRRIPTKVGQDRVALTCREGLYSSSNCFRYS
jgi:hypothetical protein